jgi:hypothetical protein
MTSLNKTKPLILGEWGTPHSTRQAPGVYGNAGSGGPLPIWTTSLKTRWGLASRILPRQPPRSS